VVGRNPLLAFSRRVTMVVGRERIEEVSSPRGASSS
jgi:hypothetical protein